MITPRKLSRYYAGENHHSIVVVYHFITIHGYKPPTQILHHLVFPFTSNIFFFCFHSLILDCYCEKTFCVGHSWEMKRYLRSKSSPNSGLIKTKLALLEASSLNCNGT